MKQEEIDLFLKELHKKVCKRGMPGNIRAGLTEEIADWVVGIAKDCLSPDQPTGVESMLGMDYCPKCHYVVGNNTNYCKKCGTYIREVIHGQ